MTILCFHEVTTWKSNLPHGIISISHSCAYT